MKKIGAYPIALSRNTKIKIDVASFESINDAFGNIIKEYGKIDAVVNCAGDLIKRDVEFMDENEWDYIYSVNIKGSFLVSKAILPLFKKQGYGSIVFVGSSSYTRGRAGYAAYSSSKAALVNFAQALSEEVAQFNIKVNVVSPGRVATPLRFRNFGKEDPKTLIKPERVAEEILSILAKDITGSVFEVR
jgi:NAD(P)-dependent dehydrogenase (short-subunit alcohol dehydrogenase family)